MKNERSIEELLADMLRKQDRQEELLKALVEGQSKIVEVQSKMMDTQSKMVDTHAKMVEAHLQTNERLNSLTRLFDQLINDLSDNWSKPILTLEEEMEAVKRKIG